VNAIWLRAAVSVDASVTLGRLASGESAYIAQLK
jgi:hypothetical protein